MTGRIGGGPAGEIRLVQEPCPGGAPKHLHEQALCPCFAADRCGAANWTNAAGLCECLRGWPEIAPHKAGRYMTEDERATVGELHDVAHVDPAWLDELSRRLGELGQVAHPRGSVRGKLRSAAKLIRAAAIEIRELEQRGRPDPDASAARRQRVEAERRRRRRVERVFRCLWCREERDRSARPCPSCGRSPRDDGRGSP